MKWPFLLIFSLGISLLSFCQQISWVSTLHNTIHESSGLVYVDGRLITHNDSGGAPNLYEVDTITGNIIRSVVLSNALNVDWEDICADNNYIYIADFGNNSGTRTDLRVYRLLISDYLNTPNDTVMIDTIQFNYTDQMSFTPSQFTTNYDAESLISYNDSLYIFTKNWGNHRTNVYALPKAPGNYQIQKIDSINAQGLVTGAVYDSAANTILLTGYDFSSAFVIEITGINSGLFSNGIINQYVVTPPPGSSNQIEGVTSLGTNRYFLTAEEGLSGNSALYKMNTTITVGFRGVSEKEDIIFPNPANQKVEIVHDDFSELEIYDLKGELLLKSMDRQIDVSNFAPGIYILNIKTQEHRNVVTKKLIIE